MRYMSFIGYFSGTGIEESGPFAYCSGTMSACIEAKIYYWLEKLELRFYEEKKRSIHRRAEAPPRPGP